MKEDILETLPTIDQKLDAIIDGMGQLNKRLTNMEADMQEVKIELQHDKGDMGVMREEMREGFSIVHARLDSVLLKLV